MAGGSRLWPGLAGVFVILAATIGLRLGLEPKTTALAEARRTSASAPKLQITTWGRLPLYFIENRGQVDRRVKYYAQQGQQAVFFTASEVVLTFTQPRAGEPSRFAARPPAKAAPPQVVRIKPVGLQKGAKLRAEGPTPCRVNYFRGNDPQKWRTSIPTYQAVVYEEAYAGIDLKFYGRGRELEYDVVVKPGADPAQVRFAYQGVRKLELTPTGDLALLLPDGGRLLQKKPVVYQEINGVRVAREARFHLQGQGSYLTCGFAVAAYDQKYPLILDPILSYATYLGGSGGEYGHSITVDASGAAYITGQTNSPNFPTSNPLQGTIAGDTDAFVAKLNQEGTALIYATYLGGGNYESGAGIAVDASGAAYIVGITWSTDFPTRNPFQRAFAGGADTFVVKLSADGRTLVYATYLGGSSNDFGHAIAVDSDGAAHVTGNTFSSDFPIHNPVQKNKAGGYDAYVAKLSPAGTSLVYATYLGGTSDDYGYAVAMDASGVAYVTGQTYSTNFPTHNPLQGSNGGGCDAFLAKLSPEGKSLIYATYLGGSSMDKGYGVAVDASGAAYVAGETSSDNFPTLNPLQPARAGGADAFVIKVNPAGNAVSYGTYFGGTGDDIALGIAVEARGAIYLTGQTYSSDFPTCYPLQGTRAGEYEAFVAKINPEGNSLSYSTYLGGSNNDYGYGIAVDCSGAAYVIGFTFSNDFPIYNPLQGTFAGLLDAFVVKIRELVFPPSGLHLLLGD